ncbi:protein kinase domain-containing protein [Streptomyces sp. MAR4 CNX-425]|uniref:protein kinase domain-containing protein n=1 Tax=Streptomyces sp. MAR4 CNX-425 TaxID=3406343 RepID=UPI003B50F83A
MSQTEPPEEPSAKGPGRGGMADSPENWGVGGLVGDGRYRLTRRLGRGGMAEVFAAEDVRLGREVAVKLLRSDLAEDPVSKARFTREAQSVAGLNHHAVVAVYDSGEDQVAGGTVPYIVMELVEGRTIKELLTGAEIPPPDQALLIISGVLEALAYSHQHSIVHRDIKPANVIITTTGAVKVMDFGIARALHGAASTMTQTGMVMGTPQYLSPEQALGRAVDTRSDLYAVGCLLYELLTGRPPFVGETPLSVVYQHAQDNAVPPSRISADAPPELDGLVMRSLAKEPEDRFQTADEMLGLLQYALRMLRDVGPHTGTWDTGAVSVGGTPPMGTPAVGATAATAALASAGGDTPQQPLLRAGGPDDGGFDPGPRQGGRGRGKVWAVAALALIAIVLGVAFAMSGGEEENPKKVPPSSSSEKPSPTKDKETEEEEPPPTEEEPTYEDDEPTYEDTEEPPPTNSPTDLPTDSSSPTGSPSEPGDVGGGTTGEDSGGTSDGGDVGGGETGETTGDAEGGDIDGTDTTGETTGDPAGGGAGGETVDGNVANGGAGTDG